MSSESRDPLLKTQSGLRLHMLASYEEKARSMGNQVSSLAPRSLMRSRPQANR